MRARYFSTIDRGGVLSAFHPLLQVGDRRFLEIERRAFGGCPCGTRSQSRRRPGATSREREDECQEREFVHDPAVYREGSTILIAFATCV